MLSDRLRAAAVHLLLSAIVAVLVLLLVFQVWYPSPMSTAVGVTQIFLIIVLVDVMMGPFLTGVVYKKGKKSLKFDLTVIVALQIGALLYGLFTVFEGRPAWVVFNVDRFDLVRVLDLDERDKETIPQEYRNPPITGPRWVAAMQPDDEEARQTILFEAVFAGLDLPQRPHLYQPLANAEASIRKQAKELAALNEFNRPEAVSRVLKRWPEADAWLPMRAHARSMVVLIHRETAQVVAVVDLAPWS